MVLRLLVFLCLLAIVLCVQLDKDFINEVVTRHNEIRAEHAADPVVKNKKMSKYAQKWANKLAKKGKLKHRKNNKYGENLSYMSSPTATGADHTDNLYITEEQFYSNNSYYGSEPPMNNFREFGHFTQIVWKASKKIGVGIASGYVVINYQPPGNYFGQFNENVGSKN